MKNFTGKKIKKHLVNFIHHSDPLEDFVSDDTGRLIIFTDLFVWKDGTVHDEEETSSDNEEEFYEEFSFTEKEKASAAVISDLVDDITSRN